MHRALLKRAEKAFRKQKSRELGLRHRRLMCDRAASEREAKEVVGTFSGPKVVGTFLVGTLLGSVVLVGPPFGPVCSFS